jgi:fimbrial chaperone protein
MIPTTSAAARWLAAALAIACISAPAHAGSLQIGPITVSMVGKERTATLSVHNVGSAATNVQVRAVDWSQPEGADNYAPSTTLLVSPPFVTLAAGETQVIRVVIQNTADVTSEKSFRVILDEVPNRAAPPASGVESALRVLVPVFLTPSTSAKPKLRWTAAQTGAGLVVTAFNDGEAHEHLMALKISSGGKQIGGDLEGYVLSHGKRSWTLASTDAASIDVSSEGALGPVKGSATIGK